MTGRVAVLASGSGTNLQALLDDTSTVYEVVVVLTNRPQAGALDRAAAADVSTEVLPHRGFPSRDAYDAALVAALEPYRVDWVVLAGFMRILTPTFLDAYPGRVLNIHPALLPAFPGLDGAAQALEYGVRVAGCTVHLVDAGTDTGPIVAQAAVPVLPGDTLDTLKARILRQEHQLLPQVVRWAAEGRVELAGRRVHVHLPEGESTLLWSEQP